MRLGLRMNENDNEHDKCIIPRLKTENETDTGTKNET